MGRSVGHQSGAEYVKYFAVEPVYGFYNPETDRYEGEEYNQEESSWAAENDVENIICAIMKAFPSFIRMPQRGQCGPYEQAIWSRSDRECWPILYNGSAVVLLAEYCDLYSISFVPLEELEGDYYGPPREGIQRAWLRRIEARVDAVLASVVDPLICCGHFSNGEAVYSRKTRRAELCAAVNGIQA